MSYIKLLEGEAFLPDGRVITQREWASRTLKVVADHCDYGSYPSNISAFDLGRALGRALVNCDEEDAYKQLLRGIDHYHTQKQAKSPLDEVFRPGEDKE